MQGIMFIEDLFKKVLTGEKTMTRRIIKGLPDNATLIGMGITGCTCFEYMENGILMNICESPRYKKGETVFLKEPCGRISGIMFYAYDYPQGHKMRTDFKGWANKMFMPAMSARYKIQITDVRIERAHDITEDDAVREGLPNRAAFELTWMKINGISSWKKNPYVFVYEFKRV